MKKLTLLNSITYQKRFDIVKNALFLIKDQELNLMMTEYVIHAYIGKKNKMKLIGTLEKKNSLKY